MDLKFRVAGRIAKPVSEVFEAVVNPDPTLTLFHHRRHKGKA